ncbi:MAG: hypothetical protein F6J99_21605 [Moorea sp. SIO4G3]|nr:hypothetical protein [Moorena sp. SIO4G3]
MQRGLGKAAPSCGGPPHERLPWFPPLALCIKTQASCLLQFRTCGMGIRRGSDAARSWEGSAFMWGSPPETKPDYVEPLWLVGYAEKG